MVFAFESSSATSSNPVFEITGPLSTEDLDLLSVLHPMFKKVSSSKIFGMNVFAAFTTGLETRLCVAFSIERYLNYAGRSLRRLQPTLFPK